MPGFGDVADGEDGGCWEVSEDVFEQFGGCEGFLDGAVVGGIASVLRDKGC